MQRLTSGRLGLFLDYDGTLTPIVPNPADAKLAPETRALLDALSGQCVVGVISGRDLEDVRARVGLELVWYGGSHGFDLAGPGGWRQEVELGKEALPLLDAAEAELRDAAAEIPGVAVERKRFSIAVHHRNADPSAAPEVEAAVDAALTGRRLRKGLGKMVFELRPAAEWDKGWALLRFLEALDLEGPGATAVFAGDDVTDEDAFRVLRERGLGFGLLVGPADGPDSWAEARLEDPAALALFLARLLRRLEAAVV